MEIKELKNCKLLEDALSPVQSSEGIRFCHSILNESIVFHFKQMEWIAE